MIKFRLPYSTLCFLLLASSCSQDEIDTNKHTVQGRIEFRASLPEVTSRATELTVAALDGFQVSSFSVGETSFKPYFLDKSFSKNDETSLFFSSDPECIWPNNGDLLRFVAFAPSCEQMREFGAFTDDDFKLQSFVDGESMTSDDYRFSGFRIPHDIASQFDFVTAIGSGSLWEDEETPIDLNFQHQLSRIRLKAWGESASFKLEIAGVRLGGVGTEGVFNFASRPDAEGSSRAGRWESVNKGIVEYIYREGDVLVTFDQTSPISADKAVSIMGCKIGGEDGYDNSAMVIPSENPKWESKENAANGENHSDGMFFSVLLRVTDLTSYAPGNLVYPYSGVHAEGMEVIYLAVDRESKSIVKTRLYKQGEEYFTDSDYTEKYDLDANSADIKAFGWAAIPVADTWEAGYVYTYTLNYTSGVGLHDPHDSNPGDPIISDRVLVKVDMTEWKNGAESDVLVPRK